MLIISPLVIVCILSSGVYNYNSRLYKALLIIVLSAVAVGYEFWKTLCAEHGMSADGLIAGEDKLSGIDNRDCFFHEVNLFTLNYTLYYGNIICRFRNTQPHYRFPQKT